MKISLAFSELVYWLFIAGRNGRSPEPVLLLCTEDNKSVTAKVAPILWNCVCSASWSITASRSLKVIVPASAMVGFLDCPTCDAQARNKWRRPWCRMSEGVA